MSGLTASQELRLEYLTWLVPDSPPLVIRRYAIDGIHQEVSEAFAAAPHRCAETGGILLGRRDADRIVVEDFEPIPSEHRFGPCYRLSDTDRELLRETLDWFRGGAQPGLFVLGFYRSNTLPEFELTPEDEDLMRSHFTPAEDLVLLVKPNLMGSSESDFCMRRCGSAPPVPAPIDPPALMAWPAPGTRPEPEIALSQKKNWPWYAAAIALGVVCGALAYLWWHPHTSVAAVQKPVATAAAAAPSIAVPPVPTPPAVEGAPAPLEPDTAGIHQLLDRWSSALKRGDVDAAAACYTPVVSTYFDRHDVTREAVRQSIRQTRARYGRPTEYGISSLGITPVSDTRAVATFRKHWRWRSTGRSRLAGQEEERMTLVRTDGSWRISSEQPQTR